MVRQYIYSSIRVRPESKKGRLEMGSPKNISRVEVVKGNVKISSKEISTAEWCSIIGTALFRIKPCLKYVAGFTTLKELLNSQFLTGYGKFVTPDNAMPNFEGTNLDQKTRFVALQKWEHSTDAATKPKHEINWRVLLLIDTGNFAILELSFFRGEDPYVVCSSILVADSIEGEHRRVLDAENPVIRDLIGKQSISPWNLLDKLYLLFYHTVSDREQRLDSMRKASDMLKQMCDKIS